LEALKKASIMTHAFVVDEKPIAVEGSSLILAFKADHRFHKERCEMESNKKIIEQVLERCLRPENRTALCVAGRTGSRQN
jgi:DNA modification methylase